MAALLAQASAGGMIVPKMPGISGALPGLGIRPGGPLPPSLGGLNLLRPPSVPGGATSKAGGPVDPAAAAAGMLAKAASPLPSGLLGASASAGGGGSPCTVYVGRISSEVSDDFVKQLLEKCGKVTKWNRAADPNTSKLTSFGFCDFEEPEGVWRALECLHEKQLCDKRLLVKCEEKAKQTIDQWKETRKLSFEKERSAKVAASKLEAQKDPAKAGREAWAKAIASAKMAKDAPAGAEGEKAAELKEGPLTEEELTQSLADENKEVAEAISKLLVDKNKGYPALSADAAEAAAESKEEDKKAEKELEKKDNGKENDKKMDNDKAAEEKKDKSEERGKKRSHSEEKRIEEKRAKDEEKKKAVSRHYRAPRREGDRERRVRERERDVEKEYTYRIRDFERNEDNRIKNLKRKLAQCEFEAPSERDIRKFVDRDLHWGGRDSEEREWKRYREDRARERAKEREKDNADRAQVQREADELKKNEREKAEAERIKKEKEEAEAAEKAAAEERRKQKEEADAIKKKEDDEAAEKRRIQKEKDDAENAEAKKRQEAAAAKLLLQVQEELKNEATAPKKKGPVITGSVSGPDGPSKADKVEEEAPRKEQPQDRAAEPAKAAAAPAEAKMKDDDMRKLIQQVPTGKAQAFAFEIDWDVVHSNGIIEKKLRPWVRKKVTEFLGAEEQGMIEFIMRKVSSHTPPATILAELEGFIDDEAENFTLKMWRMLIFEVLRVKAR